MELEKDQTLSDYSTARTILNIYGKLERTNISDFQELYKFDQWLEKRSRELFDAKYNCVTVKASKYD